VSKPLLSAAALAVVVAVGSTAAAVLTRSERAHSTETLLYVSASGSDSNSCTTRAKPCKSFNAAYVSAAPGATVYVESGTYPVQTIKWDDTKSSTACDGYHRPMQTSGCVTFEPDKGAAVRFGAEGGILILGSDVMLKGFDFGADNAGGAVNVNQGGCSGHAPSYIVLMNNRGSFFGMDGPASYIADINGYWSAGDASQGGNADAVREFPCDGDHPGPDHTRLSGGFYGNVIQSEPGQHLACAHITGASYFTIDRTKFTNCAQHDLEIEGEGTGDLIENNVFAATCSEQKTKDNGGVCGQVNPVDVGLGKLCGGPGATNLTARFNSVQGDIGFNCGDGNYANSQVYGNVMSIGYAPYHCGVYQSWGVSIHDNVYGTPSNTGGTSTLCGEGSAIQDGQWVNPNPPAYDFRLASRSVKSVGRVPVKVPGGFPAVDFAGAPRPLRTAADAGAYQWETPLLVLGKSVGGMALGEPVATVKAAYGTPRSQHTRTLGTKSVDELDYRLHGGQVTLYADGGAVVGISTSSPYYTSPGGVGVGSSMSPVRALGSLSWVQCRSSWARRIRGTDVFVVPAGGKKGSKIAGVAMVKAGYDFGSCRP
jgi:hypothetical protein